MNILLLRNNRFLLYFNRVKSENLGFYFSLLFHFFILLFAIGLPNFFNKAPIYVPNIIPVEINKTKMNEVLNIASKVHKIIGCKGVTRSDFKFYKNKFYLLEINTQPGMTSLSLVPEIARFNNISFLNLIDWIIKDASIHR